MSIELKDGQKWKTRSGIVTTVHIAKLRNTGRNFFETSASEFLYADKSEDGVFYVFNEDILNGLDPWSW